MAASGEIDPHTVSDIPRHTFAVITSWPVEQAHDLSKLDLLTLGPVFSGRSGRAHVIRTTCATALARGAVEASLRN